VNPPAEDARVLAEVRDWLERAVIGLNLCPFARAPYLQGRVRFQLSHATDEDALRDDLVQALRQLQAEPAEQCETTLLIHPWVLGDFFAYNQFLEVADACVAGLGLEGELQVASFHPHYQFAGTRAQDVENCSNRSPYPILHLLREASIARVVEAIEDPDAIPARNIAMLRALGREGWDALWDRPR
jgi:hypothetical protein